MIWYEIEFLPSDPVAVHGLSYFWSTLVIVTSRKWRTVRGNKASQVLRAARNCALTKNIWCEIELYLRRGQAECHQALDQRDDGELL